MIALTSVSVRVMKQVTLKQIAETIWQVGSKIYRTMVYLPSIFC